MSMNNSKKVSLAAVAAGAMSGVAGAARKTAVDKLMTGIRDDNAKVRTAKSEPQRSNLWRE